MSFITALGMVSFSSSSFAQVRALATVVLDETAPIEEEATAGEGEVQAPPVQQTAAERRRAALSAFDVGEVDTALAGMKDLLRECLALSEEECSPATRSILFRDVGIILADGKSDHAGAVRALRKALRSSSSVSIPGNYRSARVDAAYDEARRLETGFTPAAPVVAPVAVAPADSPPASQGHLDKSVLLNVGMALKAGSAMSNGSSGGEGLFGLEIATAYVNESGFAIGGLGHVDYKWPMQAPAYEWGNWGLAAILGGVVGRSAPTTFHYLFAGLGFEHWPQDGLVGVGVHARYGASLDGFGLGLGADVFHTTQSYAGYSLNLTEVLFGLHLGFADLL